MIRMSLSGVIARAAQAVAYPETLAGGREHSEGNCRSFAAAPERSSTARSWRSKICTLRQLPLSSCHPLASPAGSATCCAAVLEWRSCYHAAGGFAAAARALQVRRICRVQQRSVTVGGGWRNSAVSAPVVWPGCLAAVQGLRVKPGDNPDYPALQRASLRSSPGAWDMSSRPRMPASKNLRSL